MGINVCVKATMPDNLPYEVVTGPSLPGHHMPSKENSLPHSGIECVHFFDVCGLRHELDLCPVRYHVAFEVARLVPTVVW